MRISRDEYDVRTVWGTDDHIVCYTAIFGFGDYDHLFGFLRWRVPVSYKRGYEGIIGVYSDGTEDRISWIDIRDAIERNWPTFRKLLQEDGGEDLSLDEYSKRGRYYSNGDTLTLSCGTFLFKTEQKDPVSFSRIRGCER